MKHRASATGGARGAGRGGRRAHSHILTPSWQADEEADANISAASSPWAGSTQQGGTSRGGTMLVKPRRSQRQAKGADQGQAAEPTWAHTLPAQVGTRMHNLHLTKSFSCHCLAEDNKVLLIQHIRGSPGVIAFLLFTWGHSLQATGLRNAHLNKVARDLGRYSGPPALAQRCALYNYCSTGNCTAHGKRW